MHTDYIIAAHAQQMRNTEYSSSVFVSTGGNHAESVAGYVNPIN